MTRRILVIPILGATLIAPAAWADDCAVPLAAMLKLEDAGYKMHMVTSAASDARLTGGAPETTDLVATDDKTYVKVKGVWHAIPRERESADELKAKVASGQIACQYLHDEEQGGESAAVYQVVDRSDDDGPQTETLWVGKSGGRLLRIDMNLDIGGGDVGKSQSTATFDYSNVIAPADVQ